MIGWGGRRRGLSCPERGRAGGHADLANVQLHCTGWWLQGQAARCTVNVVTFRACLPGRQVREWLNPDELQIVTKFNHPKVREMLTTIFSSDPDILK